MLNKKKNNKGFTLVELLVVIAIIGILAVVAVPALFKNIEKGKIADLEADISAIRSASLSVYADTSKYPTATLVKTGTETGPDLASIKEELEGLSFPFGGTYAIAPNGTTSTTLELIIIADSKISEAGLIKLKNDLGEKFDSSNSITSAGLNTVKINLITQN